MLDLTELFQDTICDLIAIPSTSGNEAQIADYVLSFLKRHAVDAEKDKDDNVTAVVGNGERVLHINGHLDTVVPVTGWTKDPFKPEVQRNLVHGLGASDMKSGIAVMMHLAGIVKPNVQTVFSFIVCEDGPGGKPNGSRTLLERWDGDWAITTESSVVDGKLTLGLGTQGHATVAVKVKGTSAHSSKPEDGHNALYDGAAIIKRIEDLNNSFPNIEVCGELSARPSAAVTMTKSGVASNIIPDLCELTVSRRLAPGETIEKIRNEMDKVVNGFDAEYQIRGGDVAAVTDVSEHLFHTARSAYRGLFGDERFSFIRGRTDLVLFAKKGMDILNIGPGFYGQAHCADEYCRISDMVDASSLLEKIINAL